MIICPLSLDECSKNIPLSPKTVFLMTPSKAKRSPQLKTVISHIVSELRREGFNPLDGSTLVGLGATVCTICSPMQGCAMAIGFYHPGVPGDALSNIFWEMGMIQGWGRPVLLVANNKEELPSDFRGGFCISFENDPQYLTKFKAFLDTFKQREQYYVDKLADEAILTADYEKAFRYYQDAFLIAGNPQIIDKIRKLKNIINHKNIPKDLKTRLTNTIASYLTDAAKFLHKTTR